MNPTYELEIEDLKEQIYHSYPTYSIEELTIEVFKKNLNDFSCFCIAPSPELADGMVVDVQTINLVCTVYDKMAEKNGERMIAMFRNPAKIGPMMNKLWGIVQN